MRRRAKTKSLSQTQTKYTGHRQKEKSWTLLRQLYLLVLGIFPKDWFDALLFDPGEQDRGLVSGQLGVDD